MKSKVLEGIKEKAIGVYKKILKKKAPELDLPLRSLSNVKYGTYNIKMAIEDPVMVECSYVGESVTIM